MKNLFKDTEDKLLASGIEISYLPDEYLFRFGQKADFVFYVLKGKICLETPDNKGYILEDQPMFLGIEELVNQKKHTFSTHTIDSSKFLVYEKNYFLSLIQEFDLEKDFIKEKLNELNYFFQTSTPNH